MRHLIYVPALDRADPGVTLAAREAARLRSRLGVEADVAVVEHLATSETHNAATLRRLAGEHPGVRFFHVTPAVIADLLEPALRRVVADDGRRALLYRALMPTAISYGAGPNRAALFARSRGYRVLHRRDSDIQPPVDPGGPLPAEIECEHLLGDAAALGGKGRVHLVGSTYIGDPPLDRRDLLAAGIEHAVALQRLKDLDEQAADPAAAEQFVRDYLVAPGARRSAGLGAGGIGAALDAGRHTEMGIAAYAGIWEVLPEMPMRATLGSDYLEKFLLHDAGFPVVLHGRALRHTFDGERRRPSPGRAAEYAVRDLRGIGLSRVRRRQRLLMDAPGPLSDIEEIDLKAYLSAFVEAAERERGALLGLAGRAAEIYAVAAAVSRPAAAARLEAVARAVRMLGRGLAIDIAVGVHEFAALAETWPALLDAVGERADQ